VELENHRPGGPGIKGPITLETHGEAPEQYPDWDDQWDEQEKGEEQEEDEWEK
jgi:hypothetical protein